MSSKELAERTESQPECSLVLDEAGREAFWQGKRLDLSPTEFSVLAYLHQRVGRPVSHDVLLLEVWGTPLDQGGSLAQVRNTVTRLRQKLTAVGDHSCHIANVRGVGYRLELSGTDQPKRRPHLLLTRRVKKIVLLTGLIILLVGGAYVWRQLPRDPRTVVWYHNHRVPLAVLRVIQQGNYCTVGPNGTIYCFDTKEELAAATGLPMPGADPEAVRRLQESGAVPDLR
jgi:DNA-binding winged helix-turn-helix (wHTH) protein